MNVNFIVIIRQILPTNLEEMLLFINIIQENELLFCIISIIIIGIFAQKLYLWNISLYLKIILTLICLVLKLVIIQHYAMLRDHLTVRPRHCQLRDKMANFFSFSGYQCPLVDKNKIPTTIYVQIYLMDFFMSIFVDTILYSFDSLWKSLGRNSTLNIVLAFTLLSSPFYCFFFGIILMLITSTVWFGIKIAKLLFGYLSVVGVGRTTNGENDNNRSASDQSSLPVFDLILSYFTIIPENDQNVLMNRQSFLKFSKFLSKYFTTLPFPYNLLLIVIFVMITLIISIIIWFGQNIRYYSSFYWGTSSSSSSSSSLSQSQQQ